MVCPVAVSRVIHGFIKPAMPCAMLMHGGVTMLAWVTMSHAFAVNYDILTSSTYIHESVHDVVDIGCTEHL